MWADRRRGWAWEASPSCNNQNQSACSFAAAAAADASGISAQISCRSSGPKGICGKWSTITPAEDKRGAAAAVQDGPQWMTFNYFIKKANSPRSKQSTSSRHQAGIRHWHLPCSFSLSLFLSASYYFSFFSFLFLGGICPHNGPRQT